MLVFTLFGSYFRYTLKIQIISIFGRTVLFRVPKCIRNGTIDNGNYAMQGSEIMSQGQDAVNRYIELLFARLTAKAQPQQMQQIIKQNIQTKRASAIDAIDFYDRLMLNITYFVDNKAAWQRLMRSTYGAGQVPKIGYAESEILAQQMQIRQNIAEKMDDYKKLFHAQYKALQVEEEAVVYDYAYASVEHSLRFDFLTLLTVDQDVKQVFAGEFEEILRIIEGYIAYYADQFVNKMELMED